MEDWTQTLGTGPLLYLVAWQYLKAGVTVAGVLDCAPLSAKFALLKALPTSLHPVVEFGILSGQRKAEIVTLRWADVDLGAARATVWAKGQKPHSFPLTPRMIAIIASASSHQSPMHASSNLPVDAPCPR